MINETKLIYLKLFQFSLIGSWITYFEFKLWRFQVYELNVLFLQVCFVNWIDILLSTWWLKWAYAQSNFIYLSYDEDCWFWMLIKP